MVPFKAIAEIDVSRKWQESRVVLGQVIQRVAGDGVAETKDVDGFSNGGLGVECTKVSFVISSLFLYSAIPSLISPLIKE